VQTELDLIGLFAFGISGALMAIRLDFDVVGIATLAVITAVGAGSCATSSSVTRLRPRSRGGNTLSYRSRRLP
jgi:Glycine transporter